MKKVTNTRNTAAVGGRSRISEKGPQRLLTENTGKSINSAMYKHSKDESLYYNNKYYHTTSTSFRPIICYVYLYFTVMTYRISLN